MFFLILRSVSVMTSSDTQALTRPTVQVQAVMAAASEDFQAKDLILVTSSIHFSAAEWAAALQEAAMPTLPDVALIFQSALIFHLWKPARVFTMKWR